MANKVSLQYTKADTEYRLFYCASFVQLIAAKFKRQAVGQIALVAPQSHLEQQ